jgi:hypothetical protein
VPGTGHGRRAGDASSTPARTLTRCSGEALVGDRVVATMASTLIARSSSRKVSSSLKGV